MTKNSLATISLTNVYKRFGDNEAVSDITLKIKKGEVIGFVGPNGAGKSTTIAMMMGFTKPTRGKISLLGTDIHPESAHKVHAHIGYVAGDMTLPANLTGKQFLRFQAAHSPVDKKKVDLLMHRLHPVLDRPIKQLSRGNKQKLALFAALQHDPTILILDEPTSGLDPLMQDAFLATVEREAKRGVTVLMSSHILSEVSSICSRIIFMRSGKFILDKPINEITKQLGKHVILTTKEAVTLVKYLPAEVTLFSHTAHEIQVTVEPAALKSFMRWMLTKQFTDVTIKDRDLDDVFHELYKVSDRRRS